MGAKGIIMAQALAAPSKFKKVLITNKVTTDFLNSLCTAISCTAFSRPTAVSRIKASPIADILKEKKAPHTKAYWLLLSN